jgi:CBS domain-containing protein
MMDDASARDVSAGVKMSAQVGDRIVVRTDPHGTDRRYGTVREITGTPDSPQYRVAWDDGHESFLYPGPDTTLLPAGQDQDAAEDSGLEARIGEHDPIERIMSYPVRTVDALDSLRTAAETLAEANVGALVVMKESTPLGIISERDIVRAVAGGGDPDEVWSADVIGVDTVWAAPTDPILHVAGLMQDASIRHVPLRAQGDVVGIVSARDILAVLYERR